MKLFLLLTLLVSSVFASRYSQAQIAYQKEDFESALQLYYEALIEDPLSFDLHYNAGSTLFRLKRYEEAAAELQKATGSPDSVLAAKSWYNIGNSFFRDGESKQQPKEKIAVWRKAIAAWKQTLDLDEEHNKAKQNIEYTQIKLKEEIDKAKDQQKDQDQQQQDQKKPPLSEAAKKAMALSKHLAMQHKYEKAQQVLENIMAEDETASDFSSHVQRLSDVIDIMNGKEPQRSIDNANADREMEMI